MVRPAFNVGRMGAAIAQAQTAMTLVSRVLMVMAVVSITTFITSTYSTNGVVKINTKLASNGGVLSQNDLGMFNNTLQGTFQSFLDELQQSRLDIRDLQKGNVTQSAQIMQLQTQVNGLLQANATGVAQLYELRSDFLQANQTTNARITQLEIDLASAEARLAMILTIDEAADSSVLNITFAELLVQVRMVNASLLDLKQLDQVRYATFVAQEAGINQTIGTVNQTLTAATNTLFAQTTSLFSTTALQGSEISSLDTVTESLTTRVTTLEREVVDLLATDVYQNSTLIDLQTNVASLLSTVVTQATEIGNLDIVTTDLLGITSSLASRVTTLEGESAVLSNTDALQNATLTLLGNQISQVNTSLATFIAQDDITDALMLVPVYGNLTQLLNTTASLLSTDGTQNAVLSILQHNVTTLFSTSQGLQSQITQVNGSLVASIAQDVIDDAVMLVPVYGNLTLLFSETASLLATDVSQNADLVTLHTDDIALFASDAALGDRITVLENTQSAIQQSFNMLNTLDVAQIATLLLDTAAIQDTTANVTTLLNILRQDVVNFQLANNTNCSSITFNSFYADWTATSYQFGNVTLFFNDFVNQITIHNVTLTSLAVVSNYLLGVGFGLSTNYNLMLVDIAAIEIGCNALNTTFATQATGLTSSLNSTRDAVNTLILQLSNFGVSDPQVAFELAQTIVEVASIDSRVTTVETKLTNLTTTVTQLDQLVNNQNAIFNLQLLNLLSLITSAQSQLDSLSSEIISLQLAFGYFVGNQSNLDASVLAQFQQVFANLSSANAITLTLQNELHQLEANITYQSGISQAQLNQVNATLTTLILQVNSQFILVQGSITGLQAELLAHQIQDDNLFGLVNRTIASLSNDTANSLLSLVSSMTAVQTTVAILVGQVNMLNSEVTSLQVYQNTTSANITSIWMTLVADDATEALQFTAIASNFTAIDAGQAAQNANMTALWTRVELDEGSTANTFFAIANNFSAIVASQSVQNGEIVSLQSFQTTATNTFLTINNNFTTIAAGQSAQNANTTALWVRVELDEATNTLAAAVQNVAIASLQAFQTLAINTFFTINNNFTALTLAQATTNASLTSLWIRLIADEGVYNGEISALQAFQTLATNTFLTINNNFTAVTATEASTITNLTSLWMRTELDEASNAANFVTANTNILGIQNNVSALYSTVHTTNKQAYYYTVTGTAISTTAGIGFESTTTSQGIVTASPAANGVAAGSTTFYMNVTGTYEITYSVYDTTSSADNFVVLHNGSIYHGSQTSGEGGAGGLSAAGISYKGTTFSISLVKGDTIAIALSAGTLTLSTQAGAITASIYFLGPQVTP